MSDTIHSCSPFCTLPACVKERQRRDFEAWFTLFYDCPPVRDGNAYEGEALGRWISWQAATERATAQPDAKDAARYRWLREQDWFNGDLCVLRNPKKVLTRGSGLGADCPSGSRLDAAIDAAIRQGGDT